MHDGIAPAVIFAKVSDINNWLGIAHDSRVRCFGLIRLPSRPKLVRTKGFDGLEVAGPHGREDPEEQPDKG